MNELLFEYKGDVYPSYLRDGNAMQYILPIALQFCKGRGLDVGCGRWPFPGAEPIDLINGRSATNLPGRKWEWDYIVSSHCLEHLDDPIGAIEHWRDRMRIGGVLFLYLPHPDQIYWRPQHCRKHRHSWSPTQMVQILSDLGFAPVLHSERDLAWSFAVVGFKA